MHVLCLGVFKMLRHIYCSYFKKLLPQTLSLLICNVVLSRVPCNRSPRKLKIWNGQSHVIFLQNHSKNSLHASSQRAPKRYYTLNRLVMCKTCVKVLLQCLKSFNVCRKLATFKKVWPMSSLSSKKHFKRQRAVLKQHVVLLRHLLCGVQLSSCMHKYAPVHSMCLRHKILQEMWLSLSFQNLHRKLHQQTNVCFSLIHRMPRISMPLSIFYKTCHAWCQVSIHRHQWFETLAMTRIERARQQWLALWNVSDLVAVNRCVQLLTRSGLDAFGQVCTELVSNLQLIDKSARGSVTSTTLNK